MKTVNYKGASNRCTSITDLCTSELCFPFASAILSLGGYTCWFSSFGNNFLWYFSPQLFASQISLHQSIKLQCQSVFQSRVAFTNFEFFNLFFRLYSFHQSLQFLILALPLFRIYLQNLFGSPIPL